MPKVFKLEELGLEAGIGKYARQADGSVWLKCGNNVVLTTAVAAKEPKEFMGFLPLTVEYRERTSAAGKIPGGFVKREGRLSEFEILMSRLIDRPIRPLFPQYFFNEVQLLSTVFSSDGKFPTGILSIIASSLALTISPIPFFGPLGAVQLTKVEGKWEFNIDYEQSSDADSNIIIAGTKDGICMVEGYCNNLSEEEFVDLLFKAEEQIKTQIEWQLEIAKELNVEKIEDSNSIDWLVWEKEVKEYLKPKLFESLFVDGKKERNIALESIRDGLCEYFSEDLKSGKITYTVLMYLFDSQLKEIIPDLMVKKKNRVDLRPFDQVRPIYIEVSSLPCVHGSSLFQRGGTQALSSLTLGTAQDVQRVESILGGLQEQSFMVHYNFPPFATGETKPMRGPSRRDIGHGHLAEMSFYNVLPEQEKFPYTIRSVSDILESNGSSSMATVCATTMALMDAGVPISDVVSGIAMGLMKDSSGKFHVLTDILGIEDSIGLMDFKIAGTTKGIMAVQMDVKAKSGLSKELLSDALKRAKVARLHILEKMKDVLPVPRKEISSLAPRVSFFKIPVEKVGAIIGPAGKTIKEIVAKTGAQVDIDEGTVKVYAKEAAAAEKAMMWIKVLAGQIEVGDVYMGVIAGFADFGIFVELVPGKSGLIHISSIEKSIQADIPKKYKVNDELKVKVISYDKDTDRIRLIAPELTKK